LAKSFQVTGSTISVQPTAGCTAHLQKTGRDPVAPTTRKHTERLGSFVASVVTADALIDAIVMEMSEGIDCAVSFWMNQIESALHDPSLTTLGRLNAVQAIVKQYRSSIDSRANRDGNAA